MKRIDDILSRNEEIVAELKPYLPKIILSSRATRTGIFTLFILIALAFIVTLPKILLLIPVALILIGLLPTFIKYYLTNYIITTDKVIIETGLTRDYDIVKLNKIFDTNIDTNIVDALLGTGCIKLSTANDTEPILLHDIKNPKKILSLINF